MSERNECVSAEYDDSAHKHTHTHTHTHTKAKNTKRHPNVNVSVCMYLCMYICLRCVHACMYVCVYVCMCMKLKKASVVFRGHESVYTLLRPFRYRRLRSTCRYNILDLLSFRYPIRLNVVYVVCMYFVCMYVYVCMYVCTYVC